MVIENSSKVFQLWGISSENMGESMDYMFKVAQSTGIGFNELQSQMQSSGMQLQQLGFSFNESAAMMGQMTKAGVPLEQVMAGLKKAAPALAKQGLSLSEGFDLYTEAIKNAKNETEAIQIASELYGTKGGAAMAHAIRSGVMDFAALQEQVENSNESIMKAMWDTADAQEKMQLLGQQLQVAFEPLAGAMFDAINDLMPIFTDLFKEFTPIIKEVSEQLSPLIKVLFGAFGNTLKELMPPLLEIVKAILPPLVEMLTALSPVIVFLANVISTTLSSVLAGIIPIFQDVMGILTNVIQFITNIFTGQWMAAWQNIVNILKELFNGLTDIILAPFRAVKDAAKGLFQGSKNDATITPELPKLATGGFTNGVSIAGEAGREAVISFDPAYRANNISTWLKAGELLGVSSRGNSSSYNLGGFTFAPQIHIKETMNGDEIVAKLKAAEGEFCDMIEDYLERKALGSYGSTSPSY